MAAIELYRLALFNDANLVSYYRLEGNSNDSKGSNNGSDLDITYSSANGKFNQGAGFNGSSSHINIGDQIAIASGGITISYWIKGTGIVAGKTHISRRANLSGDSTNYDINIEGGGKLSFFYNNALNTYQEWRSTSSPTATLADGNWHHVCVSFTYGTGSGILVYIDGSSWAGSWVAGDGNSNPLTSAGQQLTVGCTYTTTYAEWVTAAFDDVAIFNRALTGTEISNLFDGTGGSPSISPSISPSASTSASASASASRSASASLSPSASSSASASNSLSPSSSASASRSSSSSASLSPSASESSSASKSQSPSSSTSASASRSISASLSPSGSLSPSSSVSKSLSPSASASPSPAEYVNRYSTVGNTYTDKYISTF